MWREGASGKGAGELDERAGGRFWVLCERVLCEA